MEMQINERAIALDIILAVLEQGEYSHIVRSAVLEKYEFLDKKHRSFIDRLSMGTIEQAILLDYIIEQYSSTKVKKMKPAIRNILRLSVYQLKFMDSVPASAVCNEAVKLAKKRGPKQLSGFVNGVLRNIARDEKNIDYPNISVKYSMPEWIADKLVESYGNETAEGILKAFLSKQPTTIRTNTSLIPPEELKGRLEDEGVKVTKVDELPYAFIISDFDYIASLQSFKDGLFYIQDLSSMMVAEAADVREGDSVIDVCAAPGGKALHVAELLNGTGHVEARDLTDDKVSLISENIKRSNLKNISAKRWDATVSDADSIGKADVLICDLPCSGIGIIGRKPDIKYNISKEQIDELAALQRDILKTVIPYAKSGGRIVFSTCTISREENDSNSDWIRDNFDNLIEKSRKQYLPTEGKCDGFYIAVYEVK